MRNDLFHATGLRRQQIMMLLDISQSTFYRWDAGEPMTRPAWLVLRSVAHGMPVLMASSRWWDGYYFGGDGSLRMPNGYPIWPGDLTTYYMLNLWGEIRRSADRCGIRWPVPESARA